LEYNIETMRITDPGLESDSGSGPPKVSNILNQIKTSSTVSKSVDQDTGEIFNAPKVTGEVQSSKLKSMLAGLKSNK
jgi:hypothetical protein